MIDRPQIGDVVLVFSFSFFCDAYTAEVTAIAERDIGSTHVDFCSYEVRPLRGLFRRRRWIKSDLLRGIVSRAAERRKKAEVETLEKML
jgi:hypothetical protein